MPAIAQKQLDYLMIFIKMFADSADISEKQAFNYLDRHKGIEFVRDHYDVIHTLDFDYAWRFRRKVTPCVRFKVTPLSDFKMTPSFRFKVTPTFRLKLTPCEI